jgi:hypothetical protein
LLTVHALPASLLCDSETAVTLEKRCLQIIEGKSRWVWRFFRVHKPSLVPIGFGADGVVEIV